MTPADRTAHRIPVLQSIIHFPNKIDVLKSKGPKVFSVALAVLIFLLTFAFVIRYH